MWQNLNSLKPLRIGTVFSECGKFEATLLKHLTSLQHLEYYEHIAGQLGVRFTRQGYLKLAESLKHLTSLQTLTLELSVPWKGEVIEKDEIATIVEGIQNLTSLQELVSFTGTDHSAG